MKVLIRCDSVFTGNPDIGIQNISGILVDNGVIKDLLRHVEKVNDVDIVVDGRGLFVMPGLIDLHVHLSSTGEGNLAVSLVERKEYSALRALVFAQKTLNAGFTTLRDLGANGYQVIALKEAIRDGIVHGPRILAAGRPLTETGGHADSPFFNGRVCDGEVEVRTAVREQIKMGADVIKIHVSGGGTSPHDNPAEPQFGVEEIRAAVSEAHAKYRKVAAHAQSNVGIRNAVAGGVDTIEHALFLDEEIARVIRRDNRIIVPTMVSPLMTSKYGREGGAPEWAVRKATEALDPHRKSVRLAKEIGVKIGFGTDAGTPFNFHGNNAKEFMCLVEFGDLTTTDALYAATGIAGEALGTERKIGQISKGFIADIIMIQGDPISDISVLEKPDNIRKIMLAGRLVKGTEQA